LGGEGGVTRLPLDSRKLLGVTSILVGALRGALVPDHEDLTADVLRIKLQGLLLASHLGDDGIWGRKFSYNEHGVEPFREWLSSLQQSC
jgi:hypothetical protein